MRDGHVVKVNDKKAGRKPLPSINIKLGGVSVSASNNGRSLKLHRRTAFDRVLMSAVTHRVQGLGLKLRSSELVNKNELAVSVHVLIYLEFVVPRAAVHIIKMDKEGGLSKVGASGPKPVVTLLFSRRRERQGDAPLTR